MSTADLDQRRLDEALSALGEQLEAAGARFELVVIGGSALAALGLVLRTTRDVDVLALKEGNALVPADPLPAALEAARTRVARDFGLPAEWLNPGPADLLDFGLPKDFESRLETTGFGPALTVHFAGRLDQIYFKLYAAVDQQGGRHEADLRALHPTRDELLGAARWARTHDPSEGFLESLINALAHLGVSGGDLEL